MRAEAGGDAIADEIDAGKGMRDRPQRLQRALAADPGKADAGVNSGAFRRAEPCLLDRRAKGLGNRRPGHIDAEPRRRRTGEALSQHGSLGILDAGATAGSAAVDAEKIIGAAVVHALSRSMSAPHRRSLRSSCS